MYVVSSTTKELEYIIVKDKLSGKSKKIVVLELKNQGVLQLRGAVEVLAKELGLTRATIYNYLKEDKLCKILQKLAR